MNHKYVIINMYSWFMDDNSTNIGALSIGALFPCHNPESSMVELKFEGATHVP